VSEQRIVLVVDDDPAVRGGLAFLLRSAGFAAETFASAAEALARGPAEAGCIVVDIRMPGMDGLELQRRLNELDWRLPVIVITGQGTVQTAIQAVRAGAFDFFEKPLAEETFLDSIGRALEWHATMTRRLAAHDELLARFRALSPREQEVMGHVVAGASNKEIARALDISFRTVEIHRARIMEKMQARTYSELVRMGIELESELPSVPPPT
jgi:two-component system response regulator FixJ